jgi:UDP-glucose 4,6-dehydratase
MQNILITGGLGFIGTNLVENFINTNQLNEKKIIVLDKISYCSVVKNIEKWKKFKNIIFFQVDIINQEAVENIFQNENIDIVIHLAAESHVDRSFQFPLEFSRNNIIGTHILLEAVRKFKVKKFIHMSTDEVYGESCFHEYASENFPCQPTSPYAASKLGAETLVMSYVKCFNVPAIVVRSNNVFGEFQYPDKIIPKFIKLLLEDKPCTIHGDGSNKRSYIYIQDVISAFSVIMEKGKVGEIYNIGSKIEKTNLEVAKEIIKKMGKDEKKYIVFIKDRVFNDLCYKIDDRKIRSLGWEQRTTFDEGLEKVIQWYKKNCFEYFNCRQEI